MMKFLWPEGVSKPAFKKLDKNIKTEVLIIGGGMAGICTALALKEAGVEYILAEAKTIGSGITKGTTAVISAQHGTLYKDIIKKFSAAEAKQYLDANLDAVNRFRTLSQTIDCDFEEAPSVMYTTENPKKLQKEVEALATLGFKADFITEIPVPIKITGAVRYPGMAQFHPIKFIASAAKGLNIYENTFIKRLDIGNSGKKGVAAYTDKGKITAKKVVVASHFPFNNRHGLYFLKMYQMRSFAYALEVNVKLGCTLVGNTKPNIYFRNYQNLLIVGGGDHRTGKKSGGFDKVRQFINSRYPAAPQRYIWATQDCMTLDGVPYIGRYGKSSPDVFVATGFNEWGMSTSMAASAILTDMICGRASPYEKVFSPSRSMLRPQLLANAGAAVFNLATPSVKRCTHMGCALKWNADEGTWDCPCHGSRFTAEGKVIDNPAMKDAKVK